MEQSQWKGDLLLLPGAVVYSGPGGVADRHRHLAVQVIQGRDSPFRLTLEDGAFEARLALVPSGEFHSFKTESAVSLGLVEPLGTVGASLQALALESRGLDLGGDGGQAADSPVNPISDLIPAGALAEENNQALSALIRNVLAYIEASLTEVPTLVDAAARVHLSPSRLTHRFTEEVGIPFKRYVLWARLRRMVERVEGGHSLTSAALEAGFSDSSHLTRVFRENFGLPPSILLQMRLSGAWAGGS